MRIFKVQPHVAVGPVRLGATRAQVIEALGPPITTFKKTATSRHPTDAWFENGFQVFYGGDDPVVEYVELSRDSGFEAMLFEVSVFAADASSLVAHVTNFAPFDENDPELGSSYVFPSIDVSLWRPIADEPEGQYFSTVGTGVVGYYS